MTHFYKDERDIMNFAQVHQRDIYLWLYFTAIA